MLSQDLVFFGVAVDELDTEVVWGEGVAFDPGSYVDAFAEAELAVATAFSVEFEGVPTFLDAFFPGGELTSRFVVVLGDADALLHLRDVVVVGVLFDHAAHT